MATRKKSVAGFRNENEAAVPPIEEEVQDFHAEISEPEPAPHPIKEKEEPPELLPEIIPTELPAVKHIPQTEPQPEPHPSVVLKPQQPARRRNIPRFSRLAK